MWDLLAFDESSDYIMIEKVSLTDDKIINLLVETISWWLIICWRSSGLYFSTNGRCYTWATDAYKKNAKCDKINCFRKIEWIVTYVSLINFHIFYLLNFD